MADKMMNGIDSLRHRFKGRKGQTLVEYALILSFISVLCVAFLTPLGVEIRGLYTSIMDALAAAGGGF
ncbi:MAG: hypothetical protein LV480_03400 [Methylacidiphilales bacterium]|nr:hypothetical protein [Candidatus Methylacidiphilales bacterium]